MVPSICISFLYPKLTLIGLLQSCPSLILHLGKSLWLGQLPRGRVGTVDTLLWPSFLDFVPAGISLLFSWAGIQHSLGLWWHQLKILPGLTSCVHKVDPGNLRTIWFCYSQNLIAMGRWRSPFFLCLPVWFNLFFDL